MRKVLLILALCVLSVNFLSGQIAELYTDQFEVKTGGSVTVEVYIEIPEGHYATFDEEYLGIDVEEKAGISAGETTYPDTAIPTEYGYSIFKEGVHLTKEIFVADNAKLGQQEVTIYVMYQMCLESGICLAPDEEEFTVTLNITKGSGVSTGGTTNQTEQKKQNIFYFLLLAFIGGIILNLTPCVLPVLTMRAMSLVRQSQDAPRTVLINSLLYGVGILISFIVLASIIISIKLAGESVGWGFQNQNPVFVVTLFSILFLFSLSLFDIFLLQAPGANLATQASSKKGYLGSFFMGIFAVLLGTPCMAPFLGAAIGFALLQPPLMILTIFLLVGLGFAFPFLLIGFYPRAVKVLPKPGDWMSTFKEVLGFVLLGFAIDQLGTLYKLTNGEFLVNALFYTLVLSFAAWLYGKFVTPMHKRITQWSVTAIAIACIFFGATFLFKDIHTATMRTETAVDTYWGRFSGEAVAENVAAGKPVFVDFTAAWCKNCKTNEKLVLNTAEIKDAFASKNVVMLKGDFTKKDSEILEWLTKYQRAGVPLYLLFIPDEAEPIVFPELITKQIVFDALNKIK
ncbi:MAG: thioredoxin family protein [Candidatus Cloacimonetes bacterium]|nr:thioredoxin family protein [Candidatus Cloacimonadota bacterium]